MSRRLRRAGAALLATVAVIATVASPASAAPGDGKPPGPLKRSAENKKDKLGSHDRDLLTQAVRDGKKQVNAMFAVQPGQFDAARKAVEKAGGKVAYRDTKLGYLRASVPTQSVDSLAKTASVLAVDLDEKLKIVDPQPQADGTDRHKAPSGPPKAPGTRTPDDNPYLPTNETGAVSFKDHNPQWDGRDVTIGILDTGVDLDHPALATTSTGARKIVDWVTATDPLTEGDGTWLRMSRTVTADPAFDSFGMTYTAPAPGDYKFGLFYEYDTTGDTELSGDVNRDGDDWDAWGVLYRPADHAIWVDADGDGDLAEEPLMKPYKDGFQVGHFGTDDPATDVHESVPFVVEYRLGVDLAPIGESGQADFVNIGLPAGAHGTHVAGIAAGHSLFGGQMDGAAPGAKIVSARACTWSGGCTAVAMTEGMIDLVANRGVDVVNMSIGGLPALNDGANVRAYLYDALVDTYGVQLFLSAGNNGPGVNTIGDPSVAARVISVGASVSSQTWYADYGSQVATKMGMFNFSSFGPREDGGFKPDIVAPGAAVSSIPMWLGGAPVADIGYTLPAGYGMFNGTSMASPQAAGAAALLLSAAKSRHVDASPAKLRRAIFDGARPLTGTPAYQQGNGLFDVDAAWQLLRKGGLARSTYTIDAPVCTPISDYLATPDRGAGLYDRCGGTSARTQEVKVTRTSGPKGNLLHRVSWVGNDGTFRTSPMLLLPLGKAVTVKVGVDPRGNGIHSAIMEIDDVWTPGRDALMMANVITSADLTGPNYASTAKGSVRKAGVRSYFVTVPQHTKTMQVKLDGVAKDSRVRLVGQHPYGVPVEAGCYTNLPESGCDPNLKTYKDPMPGVWEITIEAARTSPLEANPYQLTVTAFGVSTADTAAVGTVELHQSADVSWHVTNHFGPVQLAASSSPLGSRYTERPTIGDGEDRYFSVTVPYGTKRFEATIGNPGDPQADLDLFVAAGGAIIGQSADGDSAESVVIDNPPAAVYTIIVSGYAVPAGSTDFDYFDEVRTPSLGSVQTTFTPPLSLAHDQSGTVTGKVTPAALAPQGRQIFGALEMTSTTGAVVGEAIVTVGGVTAPKVYVGEVFGPMMPLSVRNGRVAGSAQRNAVSVPSVWTAQDGIVPYFGYEGHIFSINNKGEGVGQSEHVTTPTVPGIFHADGTVTELPLPDWAPDALYGRAFAINDSGAVVGNITRWTDTNGFQWFNEPYRWTQAGGYVHLPHLTDDPSQTEPLAINSSGLVVGASMKDGGEKPVYWDADNTIHPVDDGYGALLSVNDSGVAVGRSGSRAVIWSKADGLRPLPDFGLQSDAIAINASGWVIGTADVEPWDTHVVVWDPQGHMYDLTAAIGYDTFYADAAVGITDDNQFVVTGQAMDDTGRNTAILHF
ncbi:S8 family serine peptidase [Catellatospora sp. NEAU-YM18]|nr:S8 family serine peptidase [Catellatospora tritici]